MNSLVPFPLVTNRQYTNLPTDSHLKPVPLSSRRFIYWRDGLARATSQPKLTVEKFILTVY
jgi:hypothetical protein